MALQTYTFTEVDVSYVPSAVLHLPSVSINVMIDQEGAQLLIPAVNIGEGFDSFAPPSVGIVYPLFR